MNTCGEESTPPADDPKPIRSAPPAAAVQEEPEQAEMGDSAKKAMYIGAAAIVGVVGFIVWRQSK